MDWQHSLWKYLVLLWSVARLRQNLIPKTLPPESWMMFKFLFYKLFLNLTFWLVRMEMQTFSWDCKHVSKAAVRKKPTNLMPVLEQIKPKWHLGRRLLGLGKRLDFPHWCDVEGHRALLFCFLMTLCKLPFHDRSSQRAVNCFVRRKMSFS